MSENVFEKAIRSAQMPPRNDMLPGNPRYQPEELVPYFGFDNLFNWVAAVEYANLECLAEVGIIPADIAKHITPDLKKEWQRTITTTMVDEVERKITKHDIRAWVRLAAERSPEPLRPFIHLMLTSYDALDTARALQYRACHHKVLRPMCKEVIREFIAAIREYSNTTQIGRTHGQHAIPITVGFWLATILYRVTYNYRVMEDNVAGLYGKISGPVGAYNAQVAFRLNDHGKTYEKRLLGKLGLKASPISTQILPPEPLAYYLDSVCYLSAAFGQFGDDGRNLMRTEINEIREEFSSTQDGSSTMAHKRNPINFEGLVGDCRKNKSEQLKIREVLLSDHQRDLVNSRLFRDLPSMIVNLVVQMKTLLRKDEAGKSFLSRITVDAESCKRNFNMSANLIMAEPLYIALQIAGFPDAHNVVNHILTPRAKEKSHSIIGAANRYAEENEEFAVYLSKIPSDFVELLRYPEKYTGLASEKALEIAYMAEAMI